MASKSNLLVTCIPVLAFLLVAGCASDDNASAEAVKRQVDDARERLERSPGGQRILEAINAHGGLEAWYQAPTSSYTWEYANIPADLQFKSFLVADNATRRVYHNLLTAGTYGNPEPVNARFAWDGEDAWIHPPEVEAVNPRFWATSGYYFEQIPFVFADPGVNYEVLHEDMLNGQAHHLVRVSFEKGIGDSPGDTYVVYLDTASSRVGAVRYTVTYGRLPSEGPPERQTLFEYDDYVTVDGLTVPTRFR